MKTLRRLVVSPRPITKTIRSEQDAFAAAASIEGVVQIINDYRHTPGILDHLELEADKDIKESSLQKYVAEPGYKNIHLVLSYNDWEELGIRGTLLGQSREMPDKQIITYGRWHQGMPYSKKVARKHKDVLGTLPEAAIGAWHELDHGLRNIWGVDPTSTHYHFYGYAEKYKNWKKRAQNTERPRRYVRTPDAYEAWLALPWHKLEDREELYLMDKLRDALIALIGLLRKQVQAPPRLVKPLREWNSAPVSQPYGNYNPTLYPLTGHHIGVDHAVPVGTPLYAPADGEIIDAGYTKTLGYYYVYRYAPNRYLVNLHLQRQPKAGSYKAGEQIGTVGKTGLIKGVHSHTEVFTVEPNRTMISKTLNKNNWRTKTLDPLKAF